MLTRFPRPNHFCNMAKPMCQRPSGQQSLQYLLPCLSEKRVCWHCSGWCFLADRIYFCFWQAAGVREVLDHIKTLNGRQSLQGLYFHSLIVTVSPFGVPVQMGVYQGSPFVGGPGFCFLSLLPQEVVQTVSGSLALQLCFPQFEDTPWGKLTPKY